MTRRNDDVAPLDAGQAVTILLTLGLCLLLFAGLSAYAALDSFLPSTATPALLVLSGVCLVGALLAHVVGRHQ